jgi:uncharacterized protein with PQ loop repeat
MLIIGGIFWLSYGIAISKASIIISNIVAIILSVMMLLAKLKYGRVPSDEKHP